MSRILVPDREIILPSAGLAGFYKLEAVGMDAYGQEKYRRVVADWFPNLITDAGLNAIGTAGRMASASGTGNDPITPCMACKVGAGTTPPSFSDSILQSYIASADSLQGSIAIQGGAPNYYVGFQNTYRFSTGVAAGNLSEIGMGNTIGNTGLLFSRALILDGSGNPTTITILSTEVLDATYQLRSYAPTVDGSGSFVVSGVTYTYTKRAMQAGNSAQSDMRSTAVGSPNIAVYNGGIGSITSNPSSSGPGTISVNAYTNGSLVRDYSFSCSLNQSNFAINAMSVTTGLGGMQFGITPAISKDSTKVMTLNLRFGPWARYP